jgi:CDP-glucose 4,6-dehydratase
LSFWRGRNVFLTGHTGFKGSWLALWLSSNGAKIFGYSTAPPTQPSLFERAGVKGMLERHTLGDVRDYGALRRALVSSNAEVVLHLAAQPLVRDSYEIPRETYETNVMGTINVLEACRHQPTIRAAVIVTSDKCYENRETLHAYREDDPMGGHDPYSSSKGCADLATAAYARSFFDLASAHCSVASVRAGNVIGGGDWARDRLMADLMRGLTSGRTTQLRNPQSIRPWQHVLDPLHGYLSVAERLCRRKQPWEGWNFGPRESGDRTVGEVAELTCRLWGRPDLLTVAQASKQPHEARFLRLNCTKAKERMGWEPCLELEESVAWTVDWFKRMVEGENMTAVTLAQIAEYASRRCKSRGQTMGMLDG